jgi:hypothetical protein
MELVGARVRFERDFDLPFGGQTWFTATIRVERGIGGNQLNPVSLVTHALKQHKAGCYTGQSTFVTLDDWTEVTSGNSGRERPV